MPLNCNFGRTKATMMVLVVDDAELTRGDTMDRGLGMDGVGIGGSLFQRTREVFGGVTDSKRNVCAFHWDG